MNDVVDYQLYGLSNGNPYVNRELDPSREADSKLFLPLEVLPPQEDIETHIALRRRRGTSFRSTAFLLSGRAGTGRSTLTNKIFQMYRQAHGIDEELHLVEYDKIVHDSLARVSEIIELIRNEVIRENWNRQDDLMARVPDADDGPLTEPGLQRRAEYLAHVAGEVKPPMHIGLLVHGVQEDGFMDTMAEVFRHVPALIVVTRNAYDTPDTASQQGLNERRKWRQWAKPLDLRPLGGSDATRITTNRWHAAAGDELECPFELDGVRRTFDRSPQPLGSAVRWLNWLLEGRLKLYEGEERWPDATDLRLPAKWIESMVQHVQNAPRDWGGHGAHGS